MPNEIRRSVRPSAPPSPAQRAAALVGLALVLPVAVAAEAWRRHRDEVALGFVVAGFVAAAGFWRAGAWVSGASGSEGT